ncbi:MAG: hypothetical protein ABEJ60_02385 [Halodesulfurarchaeum sp.]
MSELLEVTTINDRIRRLLDFVTRVLDWRRHYYAMGNDAGQYRGTLEVTREISDLRALTGEQRLPAWDG